MTFQQLMYYKVLCEEGSLSKATEKLFITQQGLSMAISHLEAEFSCKFFERTHKGLVLTPDGEYFKDWAEKTLNNVQDMHMYFDERYSDSGIIKCAAAQEALCEIAPLIEEFENKYSDYSVRIRAYNDRKCDSMVETGEAIIGFGVAPVDGSEFEWHNLFELQPVCILHAEHPWTKYDNIPLQELAKEKFYMVDEEYKSADSFIRICAKHGVDIQPRMRVGEMATVHRLVRSNGGVGLTTSSMAKSLATQDTAWRPFDIDEMTWRVGIFKKHTTVLPYSSRLFFDYIRCRCAELLETKAKPI